MNFTQEITFITGNAKKLAEVQTFFPLVKSLDIDLLEIQSMDITEIVTEKIKSAFEYCSGPIIVDDTALYLECMKSKDGSLGLPGPLVKWFLATIGNRRMVEIAQSQNNLKAQAQTVIAFATNPTDIHLFEGNLDGHVVNPAHEIGFGWDAIFVPQGYSVTLAQLSMEEKNKMSMRGIALQKLKKYLEKDYK